jgi:hypothetical protein
MHSKTVDHSDSKEPPPPGLGIRGSLLILRDGTAPRANFAFASLKRAQNGRSYFSSILILSSSVVPAFRTA